MNKKIQNNKDNYMFSLIDLIPASIYWKDKDGKYLGCNRYMLDMAGLDSHEQLIDKFDHDLPWRAIAEELRETDKGVMETEVVREVEETPLLFSKEKRKFLSTKRPLYDELGNVMGIMGVSVDITERKQAETELITLKSEKLAAEASNKIKSEFIANMSHDIRTPITGMLGMMQCLTAKMDAAQQLLKTIENIPLIKELINELRQNNELFMSATEELLQLCNGILEIARLESGTNLDTPETFDLYHLIQHNIDLLQPTAKSKQLTLTSSIASGVPKYLIGLQTYFDRCLLNLISNALKFTEAGSVTVTADTVVTRNSHQPGEKVILKITIEDTGIGIPSDKLDSIFEHFTRLTASYEGTYKGSGLGLATVKQYVERMQGEIQVNSKLDKGTCFTLLLPFEVTDKADKLHESILPIKTTKANSPKAAINFPTSLEKGIPVLVVEDNAAAAVAVSVLLRALNCTVSLAKDGKTAVEKAQKHTYQFILMDIGLPDFDGVEATKRIRALPDKLKSQIPIIALTGHAANGERKQACFDAGIQGVIAKPANHEILAAIIRQFAEIENKASESINKPVADIIDWDTCMATFDHDEEIIREMLSVFAHDLQMTKKVLAVAYKNKDIEKLRAELHRCEGGVCYLELPQLEKSLLALHDTARVDPKNYKRLEMDYLAVRDAIENFEEVWFECV